MSLVGYARVSTAERRQLLDRQLDALDAAGCDACSRITHPTPRPIGQTWQRASTTCAVVMTSSSSTSIGSAARAGELISLIDELDQRGVGFRAINSPMDTTTPAGRAFLQIQAVFAEMERNVIRQRVREGVKAARARGRKGGGPRILTPEKLRYAQSLTADRTRSTSEICRELGNLPTSTLYHYLHADGALKGPGRRLLDS